MSNASPRRNTRAKRPDRTEPNATAKVTPAARVASPKATNRTGARLPTRMPARTTLLEREISFAIDALFAGEKPQVSDRVAEGLAGVRYYAAHQRQFHERDITKAEARVCLRFYVNFKTSKPDSGPDRIVLTTSEHESNIGLEAMLNWRRIGQLKLNFGPEGENLLIDAVQGQKFQDKATSKEYNEEFRQKFGLGWPNLLVREAIENARRAGLKRVLLIRPEKNKYYLRRQSEENIGAFRQRQARMRKFYYAVARSEGFRKQKGNDYMVLEL